VGGIFTPTLIAEYVHDAPEELGVGADIRVTEYLGRYPDALEWQVAHSVDTPK
jgi:hypothetical protein